MKTKDLKIAYNVLSELDYPVPMDLMVHIAGRIRTQETESMRRRIERMSEEELIKLDSKQKRILKIYLPDGRMIQKDNAELTFRAAMKEIGGPQVAALGLKIGRKDVIWTDASMRRKRMKNYYMLEPGYFLMNKIHTADRYAILRRIDEAMRLNWEIELG